MNDGSNSKIPMLFEILKRNGISCKQLAANIGFSTGNIADWKSGRSAPKPEALSRIADYLNCSVDYLLGRTDNPQSHTGTGVAQDENKLLTCFAALNDEGKEKAIERLEEMAALDKYKKGYQPYVAKEA